MNAQILDWSDIPFVLAVCEAGSLSGAARQLGVNHSTVFRRIEGVEKRLGVRLFERLSHGYVMTAAGEHFYRNGLQLRDGMNGIQRELGGRDLRLEGVLTVTTTDSLLYTLASVFSAFQNRFPDVELRLLSGTQPLDLMRRDADIALRPTLNPPEHWIGRNLAQLSFATYAHTDYLGTIQSKPETEQRWIRMNDSANPSTMSLMTTELKPAVAPVTYSNSLMGVFDLVRAKLGIAVLPAYLGENCAELVRIHEPDEKFASSLWVLAHPDIRRSARVHAFFEFATSKFRDGVKGFY